MHPNFLTNDFSTNRWSQGPIVTHRQIIENPSVVKRKFEEMGGTSADTSSRQYKLIKSTVVYTQIVCEKIEVSYRNVKEKEGFEKCVSKNGNSLECIYKNGVKMGPATLVYANGNTLKFTFVNDVREGNAEFRHVNGNVLKFGYQKGKKEGVATLSYKNGDVLYLMYKNDKKEGEAERVYEDGRILQFHYKDDVKEGDAFFQSTKWCEEFTYVNGKIKFKKNVF